jgi:lipoprotein-releasing system permease protein
MPDVKVVSPVSPVATGPVLLVRGNATRAVTVSGIEPETYFRIVDFSDKILRGSVRMAGSDILIGNELSTDLGADVGDKLHITAANGATSGIVNTSHSTGANRHKFLLRHDRQCK